MRKLIAVLTIGGSLAFAGQALAVPRPIRWAYQAAEAYWHQTPACASVTLDTQPPSETVYQDWLMVANQEAAASGQPPVLGISIPTWSSLCAIHVNTLFFNDIGGLRKNYLEVCADVVHEDGLLLGLHENTDPRSILDRNESVTPRVCWKSARKHHVGILPWWG